MKGATIRFFVALRKDILQYLYAASGKYDTAPDSIQHILGEMSGEEGGSNHEEEDEDAAAVNEDDSVVVRLANQIIVDAYKRGASDIHIEPYSARQDTVVRIRIDGQCREYQRIPAIYRRPLVSRLKIMARLDIAERRKPQDGKIKFRLPNNREIELRVATIPTANSNEDVVMRILAASEPMPLAQLQLSERNMRAFQTIIQKPYGLILVVGPTGSGKTTTLHSALGAINTPERKIWTAEDPVEITQYGLRQVQVNARIGFTFAAAMRSFLRADPDVVMVGEMRDEETAHIGIEASLTGHLVFSTLHTNSAVETVTRLLDMGLDPFNFADALLGVLAQRLVRTLCAACKEPYHPSADTFLELQEAYGGPEAFATLGVQYTPEFTLHRGKGCPTCNNTGYKGRIGIHELLVNNDEVRRLIQTRARVTDIVQAARLDGMTTLVQDGVQKALRGLTDLAQVKAVASK
jgi:type II secretory ATPase GspE/PulE/Tfp pilus assembly ATPase PilB-like protein